MSDKTAEGRVREKWKVIRRCVTKEQAEEELSCLFGRLTEFDALRAHFLLGCILAECKPTEPGAPLTHQEKDAILLMVRHRLGGVVDIADSWDAINAILAKRGTTHSTSDRNAPIASAAQADWEDQHGHRTEILPLIGGEWVRK